MRQTATRIVAPHGHQSDLTQHTLEILETSDHAYLEAPPASGKTLTLAMIADSLPHETAYYLAHTVDLVAQAGREIRGYQRQGLISKKTSWRFMTRAAYNNYVKRGHFDDHPPHAAFVDECHMGGVISPQPKVQFPAIVDTSDKVVWISATPWDIDEEVMGPREGATAQLPFDEAFRLGILNDTDVVRVDCSLDLHVRLADNRRALHRAEQNDYHVTGEDAGDQHAQLSQITRQIADRGLRVADVPTLVHMRHQLMAELYLSLHKGEKAIFWLPTKQHARDCSKYLNELTGDPNYAAHILGETRGSIQDQETQRHLDDWMDPKGTTKVVCVVYRLREGFDYPPLALGFDCAWNPYNHRSAVQKIGRLTRKAKAKKVGRYYYAVDAVTIAGAQSRRFDRSFMRRLGKSWAERDFAIINDAFEDMESILAAVGAKDRNVVLPLLDTVQLGSRNVRMARSGLFDVLSAKGTKKKRPVAFEQLMESAASSALEKLVSDIERGRKPIPALNTRGEGNMIRRAVSPQSRTYKPAIRERLISCGALSPRDAHKENAKARLERLVSELEKGPSRLKTGSPDQRFLFKYYNPSNKTFRPDIRDRLLACGAIVSKDEIQIMVASRLEAVAAEEALRPNEQTRKIADDLATRFGRKPSSILNEVRKARAQRLKADELSSQNPDMDSNR